MKKILKIMWNYLIILVFIDFWFFLGMDHS